MYSPLLLKTWLELFQQMARSPQNLMFWVVVCLVILFTLSRVNNYMEVKGVNRAIVLTRAMVGSIMYFFIAPIVFFFLINIIAYLNGVPLLDVGFLGKWIYLTASSYWWLLRCVFNSADIVGQEEPYTTHSIIRILWILVPIVLIWVRSTKKRTSRLMIIPFIIAVVMITRHKKADETFITRDISLETLQSIPIVGYFFTENKGMNLSLGDGQLSPVQRRVISGVLVLMVISGLGVGLYAQQRVIGLIVSVIGILGLLFIAPSTSKENILVPKNKSHPYYSNVDSLVKSLDSLYNVSGESVEFYQLTVQVDAAYKAQGHKLKFPDSLCTKYRRYFYDRCRPTLKEE